MSAVSGVLLGGVVEAAELFDGPELEPGEGRLVSVEDPGAFVPEVAMNTLSG